mgnify:CR=1 FL=1
MIPMNHAVIVGEPKSHRNPTSTTTRLLFNRSAAGVRVQHWPPPITTGPTRRRLFNRSAAGVRVQHWPPLITTGPTRRQPV